MSDPAKPDEPSARPSGAGTSHSVERTPIIGVDDAGSMFIMHNGAAASFFKGQWQPGILFEGRDLMNFSVINDPEEVEKLMKQADWALTASLKEHEA